MRGLVGEIASYFLSINRPDLDIEPQRLGTVLVAIEDGLRLHRLIDPDSTPVDAFLDALELLQRLISSR